MESKTDALANDGEADEAPCITVATLFVATRSLWIAWFYREALLYYIYRHLQGNIKALIVLHTLQVVSHKTIKGWWGTSHVPVFKVSITTTRLDDIGEATAAMYALGMHTAIDLMRGNHILAPRLMTGNGGAFKQPRFIQDEPRAISA